MTCQRTPDPTRWVSTRALSRSSQGSPQVRGPCFRRRCDAAIADAMHTVPVHPPLLPDRDGMWGLSLRTGCTAEGGFPLPYGDTRWVMVCRLYRQDAGTQDGGPTLVRERLQEGCHVSALCAICDNLLIIRGLAMVRRFRRSDIRRSPRRQIHGTTHHTRGLLRAQDIFRSRTAFFPYLRCYCFVGGKSWTDLAAFPALGCLPGAPERVSSATFEVYASQTGTERRAEGPLQG